MKMRPVSLIGVIVCAALAQTAHAQATYTLTEVSDPKATSYSFPSDINRNGEIVGFSAAGPFMWRDGERIDLSKELGASASPEAINDLGQITGGYDGPSSGFLYSNGVITDLGLVKNSPASNPDTLNNLGEVAFVALVFPPDIPGYYHWSYIYRDGKYEQIPTLGGSYVRGYAINDSSVVAGESTFKGDNQAHAVIYRNGQLIDLGTLGGSNSVAYDINQAGYVTGTAELANSSLEHAFIAAPDGRMIDLGVLGTGVRSYGESINNLNQVVGASRIAAGTTEQHAFIYTDGQMWNLNKLIRSNDPLRGYVTLFAAFGINDNGWIIAGGVDDRSPGVVRGYLLRPVAQ